MYPPTEQELVEQMTTPASRLSRRHLVEYDKITQSSDGGNMIYWALMFLLVAVIAAVFGFTGIALAAAGIAKLLFFIFLILFVITFASHLTRSTGTRI
jgi:uncharacterized membrane protein YtjA (UPF0391 family)